MTTDSKKVRLAWLDPRTGDTLPAGFAVFNENKGDYFLKIDEEPPNRHFYLKPNQFSEGNTRYRLEMLTFDPSHKTHKRLYVGNGESTAYTNENIHINYGSKYKILVLYTGRY